MKSERLNLSGAQDLNFTTGSGGVAENTDRLEAINLNKSMDLRTKTAGNPVQARDASS